MHLKISFFISLILMVQTAFALPYMNFAITGSLTGNSTATNKIVLNWSENVTAVQKSDFGVGNNSKSHNILTSSTDGNIVTLTLNYSLETNETPIIFYNSTWWGGVKNLTGYKATDHNITPVDGLSPVISSCSVMDSKTLSVMFSEVLDNSTINKSDFNISGNNITILFTAGNIVTLILENKINTGNTTLELTSPVSDLSGNVLSSGVVNCSANDTKPPEIEIIITPKIAKPLENITITAHINDSFLNKTSIKAIIANQSETITEITLQENSVFSGNWTASQNGIFFVTVTASDVFGNAENKTEIFAVSEKAKNIFGNASFVLIGNQTNILNSINSTNTSISISVKENLTAFVAILSYEQNPLTNISGLVGLKYIEVVTDNETKNNLNWVLIRIYYTDNEISKFELSESSLKIYSHNGTDWKEANTSINSTGNYLEANLTHLSFFGIFGLPSYCGDGRCNGGEDCSNCPSDCGSCGFVSGGVVILEEPENKTKNQTQNTSLMICYPNSTVCVENNLMVCSEGKQWIKLKICEYRCVEDRCINQEEETKPQEGIINATKNITTGSSITGMIISGITENMMLIISIIILFAIVGIFIKLR